MRALLGAVVLLAGCALLRDAPPDPTDHVRGEHYRRLPRPPAELWPALLAQLDAENLAAATTDAGHGLITTTWQYDGDEVVKRLGEIADLRPARRAGFHTVTDWTVTYHLFLLPAGPSATTLKVTSTIEATDRSQTMLIGGLAEPFAKTVELPSRGLVERDLVRRLARGVLPAEEMLLVTGEPGVD